MEFGGSEIDFPEDEKFTKKFVLQGKEEVVRPLFDVDLRQHLLPFGDIWHAPAREVEGNRDTLMLITTGPIDPKDARELIQQTTNLFTLLSQRTESW
jgi:carbamoylphosphate synthase small subunit